MEFPAISLSFGDGYNLCSVLLAVIFLFVMQGGLNVVAVARFSL